MRWPRDLRSLLQLVTRFVFYLADFALHLADDLLCLAFGLRRCVAGHFPNGFLDRALDLLRGTFDTVLVHNLVPPNNWWSVARKSGGKLERREKPSRVGRGLKDAD